ncbi:hypothetical protein [Sporisorium scitamineum]|uniref:Uncharacterized protein n=1 Tax=Sporisorium scitamineum TaxID=49012 RepID=A0A0F7S912_9BASI|nr:hypothetical protein [Sporisorium scitamineum]
MSSCRPLCRCSLLEPSLFTVPKAWEVLSVLVYSASARAAGLGSTEPVHRSRATNVCYLSSGEPEFLDKGGGFSSRRGSPDGRNETWTSDQRYCSSTRKHWRLKFGKVNSRQFKHAAFAFTV